MINYIYQLVSPRVFSIKYQDIALDSQVLVRPRYLSICHADQRYYQGMRANTILKKKLPMALIHECWGEVVSAPGGEFEIGQRVILLPNVPMIDDEVILENYRSGSHFLSSGYDGFLREIVDLPADRMIAFDQIDPLVAAMTELVSVGVHGMKRLQKSSHKRRDTIGIWGDGSVAYIVACVLTKMMPNSNITVVGRNPRKLSMFSFVYRTILADTFPPDFAIDHAFECAGGEGSEFAINDIIRYIRPQGTVILMGVTENKVAVNTRDILEKGLIMMGSSRSGREDFVNAVELLKDKALQRRLRAIIYDFGMVKNMDEIHQAFATDLNTPFKTVFQWGM